MPVPPPKGRALGSQPGPRPASAGENRAVRSGAELDDAGLATVVAHTKRQVEEPQDLAGVDDEHKAPVDDHVDPAAILPQPEVKDAGVVLDEQIVERHDVVEQSRVAGGAE